MTLDRWKLLFPTCSILIDQYTWREGEKDTLNYWDAALEWVLMYHVLLTVLQNQYWRVTYLVLCLFFFNWFVSFSFNSTLSAEKNYIYYVLIVFLLLCWHGKDGLISPRVGTALEHLPCLFSCHPTCRAHQVSTESFGVGIMLCFCWLANSTRQSFYYKWLLGVDLNVDKEACGSI